ncbi:hypothetical protein A2Z61_00290 [Candidatus Campbellbacteria bacterium RIFCSPLOWO2_02_35_12]|uniref:Transposase IS200-like domain-containing protein n=1 Tax=Candidatus Campbellbacteria bacterium RIFCSPLOWO2_02_35_12 TaxID=1797580 RepID=A0A1F5EG90_9BACT|nr:MAG: hypothetical protein A2Z61_00290 [Candidatus Campbellbacteria bacterium RIFCSPLOWO2_02_35_12]
MNRKFQFSIGEFYHLYNRGINKMPIFLNVFDKKRFIKLLFVCNSRKSVVFKSIQGQSLDEIDRGETLVDIGIYCLVPNHFHLLIKEKTENGISEFVKKVATGYSMYFNKKYERTGSLFEGPFKAKRIDTDEYLKYIFSYIHLNPIKIIDSQWKENKITDRVKAKNYLQKYPYSSYFEYIGGKRQEEKILEKDSFPEYFSQPKEFDDFINDWLSFNLIN